jgi:hypothetical protein
VDGFRAAAWIGTGVPAARARHSSGRFQSERDLDGSPDPLTRTVSLASAPGNVLCRPRDNGLPKPSVVNVSQVTVADRRRLLEKAGALPGRLLTQVEDGLRLVLEL